MLFRMRVLFYSKAGNAEHIAQQIARAHKTTSDQIPPAYPSDGEKLLIIGIEPNGSKPDKQVLDFCSNLTQQRAKNVAFFIVTKGGTEAVETLKKAVQQRGIDVIGEPYVIKVGGLLKQSRAKQEDVEAAVEWSQKIVDEVAAK